MTTLFRFHLKGKHNQKTHGGNAKHIPDVTDTVEVNGTGGATAKVIDYMDYQKEPWLKLDTKIKNKVWHKESDLTVVSKGVGVGSTSSNAGTSNKTLGDDEIESGMGILKIGDKIESPVGEIWTVTKIDKTPGDSDFTIEKSDGTIGGGVPTAFKSSNGWKKLDSTSTSKVDDDLPSTTASTGTVEWKQVLGGNKLEVGQDIKTPNGVGTFVKKQSEGNKTWIEVAGVPKKKWYTSDQVQAGTIDGQASHGGKAKLPIADDTAILLGTPKKHPISDYEEGDFVSVYAGAASKMKVLKINDDGSIFATTNNYPEGTTLSPNIAAKLKKDQQSTEDNLEENLKTAQTKKLDDNGLPNDLGQLTQTKSLGGSTGAKLYQDDDGNEFVVKKGASKEHVEAEFYADRVYEAAGVAVPKGKLFQGDDTTKVAEFIKADQLGTLAEGSFAKEKAYAELRKNFVLDAVLGNRDVLGMSQDNVLVDKDGKVWRIDNGSSFDFRAQGGKKDFGTTVVEIDSMRDPKHSVSKVYGKVTDQDVWDQAVGLHAIKDKLVAAAPDQYKSVLAARIDNAVIQAGKKLGYSDAIIDAKTSGKKTDTFSPNDSTPTTAVGGWQKGDKFKIGGVNADYEVLDVSPHNGKVYVKLPGSATFWYTPEQLSSVGATKASGSGTSSTISTPSTHGHAPGEVISFSSANKFGTGDQLSVPGTGTVTVKKLNSDGVSYDTDKGTIYLGDLAGGVYVGKSSLGSSSISAGHQVGDKFTSNTGNVFTIVSKSGDKYEIESPSGATFWKGDQDLSTWSKKTTSSTPSNLSVPSYPEVGKPFNVPGIGQGTVSEINGKWVKIDGLSSKKKWYTKDELTSKTFDSKATGTPGEKSFKSTVGQHTGGTYREDIWTSVEWKTTQKTWAHNLIGLEQSAFRAYTGNDYKQMNNWLRGQSSYISSHLQKHLAHMDRAIERVRMTDDVLLYRAVSHNTADIALKGKSTFVDEGYVSTSTSLSMASNWKPVLIKIRVPKGSAGAYMSQKRKDGGWLSAQGEGEREVLLPRNSKFRILSEHNPPGGKRVFEVELIENDE